MKSKIMSLFIALTMVAAVISFTPVAFAATEPQVIKNTSASLNVSATLNETGTNKSWVKCTNETLVDDLFTDVYRVTSIGTYAAPGTNQFRFQFAQDVPEIHLNEYCYFSFYYRVNSSDGSTDYTSGPPGILVAPFNMNSGTLKGGISTNTFDEWKKVSVIGKMTTNVTSGSMYVQITFSRPVDMLPAYCIDFAQPTLIYFGEPDGETDTEKELYVQQFLNDPSFSSVTLNGVPISLKQYPQNFSDTVIWEEGTSFEAVGKNIFGEECDTTYSEPGIFPCEMNIVSYAKNYDFTEPDDTLKTEYKISISPAEATSQVLNDGYEVYDLSGLKGGDELKMCTNFYNYTHEDKTYLEVLKIFKGNKIQKIYIKKYSVDSQNERDDDSFLITLPDIDYTNAYVTSYVIETDKFTNVSKAY